MVGRGRRALACLVGASALACAALAVPSAAQPVAPAVARAAVSGTLTLEPATPIVGERPVLSGRAPVPAKRPVRLQARRADGTWRSIDRRSTRADRTFRFRLDRVGTGSRTLRVVGPATDGAGTWRSQPLVVTPTEQTLRLVVPTENRYGDTIVVTAVATPARPGRHIAMWIDGGGLGSAAQDAQGRATMFATAHGPGGAVFRATTLAHRGAVAVESEVVTTTVTPAVTGIPRVDIVTEDGEPITSGTDYKRATFSVDPRGSGVPSYSASARLRVRGNFTATVLEKLPYKIKLDASEQLAGMPKSKDWVLLANYFDRSLLRTTVGMEAARRLGLPWSPRVVDVEVRLNGTLVGLYQLGEGVEVDEDRVDIDLADEASDAADGGYLLEADVHEDDEPAFVTGHGLQTFVSEPKDASADFVAGVASYLQGFEDALYAADFADPVTGYAPWIDRDSFVDWYLVMELLKTSDAGMLNSVRLQRDVGGPLAMGPVWDLDISAGNRVPWEGTSPTGWFLRRNWYGSADGVPSQITGPEGQWFVRLLQDPAFEAAVRARWLEVRPSLAQLPSFLGARRNLVQAAALRNFAPVDEGGAGHPIEASVHDPEYAFRHWASYAETVDALSDWLTQRVAWMDDQLS